MPESSASVNSEGLLSTTVKVSSASSNWSSSRDTVTVFSVSPMAKFRVPLAAVKSTSLVAAVVDPSSAVVQSTEAARSLLARFSVTVNSMVPSISPAEASETDTSGGT